MNNVLRVLAPGVPALKELVSPYVGGDASKIGEVIPQTRTNLPQASSTRAVIGLSEYRSMVNKLRDELKNQEGKAYITEEGESFSGFTSYEEQMHKALKNVSDILGRSHGRRTGMFAWCLMLLIKYYGFEKDNYNPIEKILEQDPNFVKQYAEYYSLIQSGEKEKANEYLEGNFNKDEKKQNLAKLACFVMNTCNKLPSKFLFIFPIAFSLQNLFIPLFARIVKTGPIGKLFDFMRLINPWVSEFVADPVGLYKGEIDNVKRSLPKENEIKGQTPSSVNLQEGALTQTQAACHDVESIKVTNLTEQEYRLQKIVEEVNAAFERLFGRKTTLSSWILIGLLWMSPKKYKGYQEFANQFVNNPKFIKKLCDYLIEVKTLKERGDISPKEEGELFKAKFTDPEEKTVARIIYIALSIANYMPNWLIDKAPKYFGLPYSFQYLFMPIITKFIKEEGFWGKLFAVVRDFNPIINDLVFDPIATFQEEINGVRLESESIKDLLPTLIRRESVPKVLDNLFSHVKSLITTIRDFVKGRITKKPEVKAGVAPA